jgi:hypothetical protein
MAQSSFAAAKTSTACGGISGTTPPSWIRRLLQPSLADVLFVVFMAILFMAGAGWSELLSDGESGTHIKTGEYILAPIAFPLTTSIPSPISAGRGTRGSASPTACLPVSITSLDGKKVVPFCATVICFAITLLFPGDGRTRHRHSHAAVMTIIAAGAMNCHY